MKTFFFSIALFITINFSYGQTYERAVGVRLGLHNGVNYRQFITYNNAVEGIVSSRWHGWAITGLYEFFNEIDQGKNLHWYYGFGAHAGSYSSLYTHWDGTSDNVFVVGADGILGIEYAFDNIPLAISIDWKPYLNLIGYSRFFGDGGGLSVRYTF